MSEPTAPLPDEAQEADYLEQVTRVDETVPDEEVPAHAADGTELTSTEANPADVAEQHTEVTGEEDYPRG